MPGICTGEGDQSSPAAPPCFPFSVPNAQPRVGSGEGGRVSHSYRGRGASRTGWKRHPRRLPHRPAGCCPASSRSPPVEVWDPPRRELVSSAVRFPVAEAGLPLRLYRGTLTALLAPGQPVKCGPAPRSLICPPPALVLQQLSSVTTSRCYKGWFLSLPNVPPSSSLGNTGAKLGRTGFNF